jgi:TPR repeat protein
MVKVQPRTTTVYKLEATGPGGQTTTQDARVTVAGVSAASLYIEAVAERRAGRPENAASLFRQAADMGDTRAMLDLGNMSEDGKEKNYDEAIRWFRMAADRGSSEGMRDLGGLYYLGMGKLAPPDFSRAAFWFEKAANSGEPDAKYDLGRMYEDGLGVAKDLDKARQLYQDAAKLGNDEARKRLAELSANH